MQVKLTKIVYIGTLFVIWFIQDSSLYRIPVYTGFQFIQDSSLLRVWFAQVSMYLFE